MNTTEIYKMCYEIYRDLRGKNAYDPIDEDILNTIFRLYNTTEIDWLEVKALWIEWLNEGNLSIDRQIRNANNRNRMLWALQANQF